MKNKYLELELESILIALSSYLKNCELATIKDDGVTDKEEEKIMKKVKMATSSYEKKIKNIIEKYRLKK